MPWRSLLCVSFSPLRLCVSPAFRVDSTQLPRGNLHIPSPLYATMSSAPLSWSFDADYLQACNCDYGCPCEFSAPPTPGFCEGTGTWRIKTGRCGDVPLDGLCLGFAADWPKAIHLGGGTVTGFIFKGAEVVSVRDLRVSAGTINFRFSDKAGFVTEVHYQNERP